MGRGVRGIATGTLAALSLLTLGAPAFAAQAGTTLDASVTATSLRQSIHQWSIAKTVSQSSLTLFRGDAATVTYTVAATDTGTIDLAFLDGGVTVTNSGGVPTQGLAITVDVATTGSNATLAGSSTVDVSAAPVLDPGQTYTYPYSVIVASPVSGASYKATAAVTITDHSSDLGQPYGPSPSVTTTMTSTSTPVNATVDVDDSNGSSFSFSGSGSRSYTKTFACDADGGSHVNVATIRETGQSASATVNVACYALSVQTSAQTRSTRTYTWAIAKSANASSVTLEPDGSSASVGYSVGLTSSFADSAWGVSGSIVVSDPAPIPAPLSSVTAALPTLAAGVSCPASSVPANGSLTCTYDAPLGSAASTTVEATATLANVPSGATSFAASAAVDFSTATITSVDPSVTVSDASPAGVSSLGTVNAGDAGTFSYTTAVGPYPRCGAYTFTNAATFTAPSGATGTASVSIPVTVKCYQLGVSGTSSTAFTRTYTWTITKTAGVPSVTLDPGGATTSVGYAVGLSSTPADGAWAAAGSIAVTNPAPVSASLSGLAAAAGSTGATVSCPSLVIPPSSSVTCSWSAALGGASPTTLLATASLSDTSAFTTSSYSASTAVDFSTATITSVDPSVNVSDSSPAGTRSLGTVAAGSPAVITYSTTVGPYASCGSYAFTNTATFSAPSGATNSSSVTTPVKVTCYQLGVGATSGTSATRTYSWTIAKAASVPTLTLSPGGSSSVGYTVTLGSSSVVGGWSASGTITVSDPAPVAATLASISASSSSGAATAQCPMLTVPAGGSITCTWTLTLASGSSDTLTVTASLADASAFTAGSYQGTAPIDTSTAQIDDVDKTVSVTDSSPAGTTSLGTFSAGATAPLAYSLTVGPYASCGSYAFTNTATYTGGTTGTRGGASATVAVSVTCPPPSPSPTPTPTATPTASPTPTATHTPKPTRTPKPTPTPTPTPGPTPTPSPTPEPTPTPAPAPSPSATPTPTASTLSCTYTIGYWKNHPDAIAPELPVWLGTAGGPKSKYVATTSDAVYYLGMADASNGIDKLYAQLLAAKLNVAAGADDSAVADTIAAADSFLATTNDAQWKKLHLSAQMTVLTWASQLDAYNNGTIGPGHCPS